MAQALPPLREDLRLYPGPVKPDGSPSWRVHDPVRNRFYEIGWIEFELLSRWKDFREPLELMRSVAAETPIRPEPEELEALVKFLHDNNLVQMQSTPGAQELKSKWMAAKKPWYVLLLHNYLFFRIPLFKPDRLLERTLPYVRFVFTRRFAIFLAVLTLIDVHLVLRRWDEVRHAFLFFFNLEGLFYYFVAASVAKVIHELGHAYAAKYYGLRVPTMGVAFLVMWPVLYTDTGEGWKLYDARERFLISAAGVASELMLAIFATLGWALAADGPLKSMLFLLATTTWITTIAINVSPFMRFDGYFLLSDALDIPNLHDRAGALARRWVRRTFFSLDQPDPEPSLPTALKRKLIVFALVTWIYRFGVFLTIALVVYHKFFKLLGICLMMVEVIFFMFRPIATELAYLWSQRAGARPVLRSFLVLVFVVTILVWMFPVANQVEAPALIQSAHEYTVYPPFAARLDEIPVRNGEAVRPDTVVARLDAPELRDKAVRAALQARAYAAELSRSPASSGAQERAMVLEQQLNQAVAQYKAAVADMHRLDLHASIDGVVRDLPADMIPGRWVDPRQVILRVVSPQQSIIDGYVGEEQLKAVKPGQRVRFYPDASNLPVVTGTVKSVDPVAIRTVPNPILSSTYGGELPASRGERGELVPHQALYRVRIVPDNTGTFPSIVRGTVLIRTGFFTLAQNFMARAIALIIRESGF